MALIRHNVVDVGFRAIGAQDRRTESPFLSYRPKPTTLARGPLGSGWLIGLLGLCAATNDQLNRSVDLRLYFLNRTNEQPFLLPMFIMVFFVGLLKVQ